MQKNDNQKKMLSVIIPAFRQEKTILSDLRRIEEVLKQLRYRFEMIVVVDGEVDKTYAKAKKIASSNIKIVTYKDNKGKGYAIRYGMARSKGSVIAFMDSGMDINPNGLSMLIEHFEWYGADIVVGSKRHPASKVKYPLKRKIISWLSQMFIRSLFGLNISDTQVGMKFFRRKVIEDILPRLMVKGFAFDIEILVVAYYLGYKKIFEAPVEITYNFKESIISQNLSVVLVKTFIDTLSIFYRLKIERYYDSTNKKGWELDPDLKLQIVS